MGRRPKSAPATHEDGLTEMCERLGATLIHEMRHPLLGIKAGLDLLALNASETLRSSPDFTLVRLQTSRLEELFRTYQQLFSHEAIDCTEFALAPAVRRSVDLLDYRLARLGHRFWFAEDPDARGFGAAGALVHALTNLIANALDALEEAGGERRMALRMLSPPESPVEIRVSDEGAGIPPEHREHIFTPWFTTKQPGKGTGLGLAIARTLMVRAQGDIRLVADDDPLRLPWAAAEFAVIVPPAPK